MARKSSGMQQASISEFFEKNKHFLGFDTLPRSIITAVKEAVDNALDAAEEKRILPDISVEIRKTKKNDELMLVCQDNGPGIPHNSLGKAFGSLLFGSRFHSIRQSRGQQGIGITGVVMYSQLTTGKPTKVISKIAKETGAVSVNIGIDTKKNKAIISGEKRFSIEESDDSKGLHWIGEHGIRIESRIKAKYQRGKQSVRQYLKMTSIVNPHASISFKLIDENNDVLEEDYHPRVTDVLPKDAKPVAVHPHGLEIAILQRMLRNPSKKPDNADPNIQRMTNLQYFLYKDFSAISKSKSKQISQASGLHNREPQRLKFEDAQKLLSELKEAKLPNPDTECLSPIEDLLIKKGLSKAIDSRFVSTVTREPKVTNGNPFQVEVGLIYGGDMLADQPIQVLRFANRVPLMYQQGGCLLTKALESVNWKQYGLEHPGGRGIPKGPAAILIHLASTNVQFTSEAKEALADNSEVLHELEQAMKEVGRGLRNHLKKSVQKKKAKEKFELVNIILPEIHNKVIAILDEEPVPLEPVITKIMNAVFLEETVEWEPENKVTRVSIEMYNYTARPRAYSLLSTWPEREGVMMADNPLGGRREAKGLWVWKLDTLDPGCSTTLTFTVSGLAKGDWTEIDIFFRGAGDIIGATKLDEAILAEMLREEEASIEPEEVIEIVPMEVHEVEVRVEVPQEILNEAPVEVSPDIVVREETQPSVEDEWSGFKFEERGEEE